MTSSLPLSIVTSCTNQSDLPFPIFEIRKMRPNINFIAYVDSDSSRLFADAGWSVKPTTSLPSQFKLSPRFTSRIPKLYTTCLQLPTQYVLWIDASIVFNIQFIEMVEDVVNTSSCLSLFNHYKRKNVFSEAFYCFIFGKLSTLQLFRALSINPFPPHKNMLFMGGILLWNQKHPLISKFQNSLFNYTLKIGRDQLVLPALIRRANIPYSVFSSDLLKFVDIRSHQNYSSHPSDYFSSTLSKFFSFIYKVIVK